MEEEPVMKDIPGHGLGFDFYSELNEKMMHSFKDRYHTTYF